MNKLLAEFLVADNRPKATMNYPELNGFLYAIACSPNVIPDSEWIPKVFNHQNAQYSNDVEENTIKNALISELSNIENRINSQEPVLPVYFKPSEIMLENFDEDSPIAHWGRGFNTGHRCSEEFWKIYLSEKQIQDINEIKIILNFFADKNIATQLLKEKRIEGLTLADFAESMLDNFDHAAQGYAYYGLSIRNAIESAPKNQ